MSFVFFKVRYTLYVTYFFLNFLLYLWTYCNVSDQYLGSSPLGRNLFISNKARPHTSASKSVCSSIQSFRQMLLYIVLALLKKTFILNATFSKLRVSLTRQLKAWCHFSEHNILLILIKFYISNISWRILFNYCYGCKPTLKIHMNAIFKKRCIYSVVYTALHVNKY